MAQPANPSSSATGRPAGQPRRMTCPKCGTVQPRADECVSCGVVIAKARAAARQSSAQRRAAAAAAAKVPLSRVVGEEARPPFARTLTLITIGAMVTAFLFPVLHLPGKGAVALLEEEPFVGWGVAVLLLEWWVLKFARKEERRPYAWLLAVAVLVPVGYVGWWGWSGARTALEHVARVFPHNPYGASSYLAYHMPDLEWGWWVLLVLVLIQLPLSWLVGRRAPAGAG